MNGECQELLMADVIRIDIMPTEALKVSIPYNVPNIAEAQVTMANGSELTNARLFADSLLSLNLAGDALADAEMQAGFTYKPTPKRSSAGVVYTHSPQVPIESGFQTIRAKERALQDSEFHIVFTTVSGDRYLVYGVTNTCQFSIDDQIGESAKMTIKPTVQSMSGFVKIA